VLVSSFIYNTLQAPWAFEFVTTDHKFSKS
jgi:hypothetical protein